MSAYQNRKIFAALPRTERGRPIVLGADPKGNNFLYTHGNSVIIRNLANPDISDVYTQHSCQVNVAKYSPSGFYIASADKSGKIRIWDTVNAEHILKSEYQPISGPINDLAWSQDNQRIVCVGEGREKFGHVFLADTGTSNGDITGQSRPVNSCDFRPARPFRIITGSEDNSVAFYEGPPFKFKGTKSDHSRYCQSVRYSPDGNFWASGGFDGKIFLYDGKESELQCEIQEGDKNAHGGGIYGISWAGNSRSFLSCSGDKSCKIWDVETKKSTTTFNMGTTVEDQQVGCLWSGNFILSVSLSGFINYLDPRTPSKPVKIIAGHNKPITKMVKGYDDSNPTLLTAGSDGRVVEWTVADAATRVVQGDGHGSQVTGLKQVVGSKMASVGIDDSLKSFDQTTATYLGGSAATKLKAQPRGLDHKGDLSVVTTVSSILMVSNGQVLHEANVDFEPSAVSILNEEEIAVGESSAGNSVRIYGIVENTLEERKKIVLSGAVTDLAFSPDGSYLVTADGNRKVTLFSVANDYAKATTREWGFHTAKVNCVAWSPNSLFVASGGLDCSLIVWSVEKPEKHKIQTSAHSQSQLNSVVWLDNQSIATCGQDGNVKIWDVDLK